MSIHQNLRQLRLQSKMTQEQVAQKVGITRQALSSYEGGRTRPDIDMLLSLASVYETDLDGILYGQERHLQAMRPVRVTAAVLFGVLTALTVLSACFLMIANRYFPLPLGQVSSQMMPVLNTHIWLNDACKFCESLILAVVFPGLTVLLCLKGRSYIPLCHKLLYGAVLGSTLLLISCLFAIADPVFTFARYAETPLWVTAVYAIFLLIDVTVALFRKKTEKRTAL